MKDSEYIKASKELLRDFCEGYDDPVLTPFWHKYEIENGSITTDQTELLDLIEGAIAYGAKHLRSIEEIIQGC